MPAEIRTPFTRSAAQSAGPGVWRKKVLPVGQVEYKGTVLNFDQGYLQRLASAFTAQAYDQVPFQIADARNTHTNDPERYRGDVLGMDVRDDGLWVTVKTTPEGGKLLMSNPKLGVSARIVEDYARSDGKHFPAAIQHVLGTLDPRIPGLGAWESVEMSNVPDMIIDLSAATFAGEEGGITMPELSPDHQRKLAALLDLDPAAIAALTGAMEPGPADDGDDDVVSAIESMTDEEFLALQSEMGVAEPQLAGAGADLSNDYGMSSIEMANYQLAETQRQMSVLQREHDRQAFENEKRRFLNLGVPLFITDLARPLLEGAGRTVELANGDTTDAGLVMRKVLTEFGRAANMLDMSGELGSSMDVPGASPETSAANVRDVLDRFRSQTGI